MAFTVVTVELPLATGTITFQLDKPISNGSATEYPVPVAVTLNADSAATVDLAANDDTGTTPEGSAYWVIEAVTGASRREYKITVPSGLGATLTLASLMPGQPGFG